MEVVRDASTVVSTHLGTLWRMAASVENGEHRVSVLVKDIIDLYAERVLRQFPSFEVKEKPYLKILPPK